MTIAAHIVLTKDSAQNYLFSLLSYLAEKHAEYTFVFFMPEPIHPAPAMASNIRLHLLPPRYQKRLWIAYWYRYKLPGLLKKQGADVFISEMGRVSTNCKIPQYIFLHAARPNLHHSLAYTQYPYLHKRNFLWNAQFANAVLSTHPANHSLFTNLRKHTKMVDCLPGLPDVYRPFSWEENQETQKKYAKEEGYFLFVVTENTKPAMLKMLKAFSIFKKWQRSNMKLMFLLHHVSEEGLVPNFNLYKYKDEIIFHKFDNHAQAAILFAAAYLQVYYPVEYADENYDVYGLQCGVPLIVPELGFLKEKLQQAACYTTDTEQALADRMILLYKDENLKNGLLAHAPNLLKNYDWKQSAEILEAELGC